MILSSGVYVYPEWGNTCYIVEQKIEDHTIMLKIAGLSIALLLGIALEARADRVPLQRLRDGYYTICDQDLPNDGVTPSACFSFKKTGNRVIGWSWVKNVKYTGMCVEGSVRANTVTGSAFSLPRMVFGEAEAIREAESTIANTARGMHNVGVVGQRVGNPALVRGRLDGQLQIMVHYRSLIFDTRQLRHLTIDPASANNSQLFRSGQCRDA